MASRDLIIVLDFGAQYTQLIARRIREGGVFAEILPFSTPWAEIAAKAPRGIVLSGGPASVYGPGAPVPDPALWAGGVPILGICYGMQLMARELGGDVRAAENREYGRTRTDLQGDSPLFAGFPERLETWMSHGDRVESPPPGFFILASTPATPVAAMGDPSRGLYAVQFHPEVNHTERGTETLRNFIYEVAGCQGDWTASSFIEESIAAIREKVGSGRALVALSGGVDSAVAAALVQRAIGDRLTAVFVDHGLLRAGEGELVAHAFRENFPLPLVVVDARERFLGLLAGVTDPEEKRKGIGNEFIRVFEEEASRLGQVDFLVQGTLYPDVIESGPGSAAVIKSHHNVGGLPERMNLGLVEPLRELFKDEVRQVGLELGLPESLVYRQPFPGPGLAIRIVGAVTSADLEILRAADSIVCTEIEAAGLGREVWQYFAVLPGARSVGVMGDERTYAQTVAIRAVRSLDGMTADWVRLPYELLDRLASRIIGEVPGVNRVVYDITSKPPGTIEWE